MVKEFIENREKVIHSNRILKILGTEVSNALNKIEYEKLYKISEIKDAYHKKEVAIQKVFEEKKNSIIEATEVNRTKMAETKRLMKLLLIKNSLEDFVVDYEYKIREGLENDNGTVKILKEEVYDFFELHTIIYPNDKPKNRFELTVFLFVKNYRLRDYEIHQGVIDFNKSVFTKSFSTMKEASAYYNKNYGKMIAKAVKLNKELLDLTDGKTFDPLSEFDFRLLDFDGYSSSFRIEELGQHEITGTSYHIGDNTPFKVLFDPNEKVFKINTTNEKVIHDLKAILQGSWDRCYFWIDNPTIISI